MSDARDAWSESRLERQSSMSPDGIASRLNDDPSDADPAAPRNAATSAAGSSRTTPRSSSSTPRRVSIAWIV